MQTAGFLRKSLIYRSGIMPKIMLAFILLSVSGNPIVKAQKTVREKPNIILIMADDMGYSDIGCYGSEIQTPNLDQLAGTGIKLSQFYNNARCCPSRASLLTGLYPHMAGMGWMTGFDMHLPGYRNDLNDQSVTIAEVLKLNGYSNYMSGKWHVSENIKFDGPKYNWPLQRGFDKYFGIIRGGSDYFNPSELTSGNNRIDPGTDFYMTDAITDTAVNYLKVHHSQKAKSPFFMYVAYNAPHWPLHAKQKDIDKYMSTYSKGWDSLRAERYQRQQKLGIFDASVKLTDRDVTVPAWNTIPEDEKALWIKRMAVYAAQVDCLDQGIGEIIKTLKDRNVFNNTLIFFIADNGGSAEGISRYDDKSIESLGGEKSFESYRINWANASNTPFRLYKHWVNEGGISTPCIISWPQEIKPRQEIINTPAHLIDLMPTFIDISGAKYPDSFNGKKLNSLPGKSLRGLFTGKKLADRPLFWEHEANRALRLGKWKLVSKGNPVKPYTGAWELYNMKTDRSETNDLSGRYPERVKIMEIMWNDWAARNRVFPLNGMTEKERVEAYQKDK